MSSSKALFRSKTCDESVSSWRLLTRESQDNVETDLCRELVFGCIGSSKNQTHTSGTVFHLEED